MQVKAVSGWRDPHVRPRSVPNASEYDAWIKTRNRYGGGNLKMTGIALRRAVIMRRQGESWKDIGYAVGFSSSTIKNWCEFLPLDLRP